MLAPVTEGQATLPIQRRREILDAAAGLLAERSWDGFAMRDVATRAGLSAGAVYQYFDGKRDIFAALYAERLSRELAAIEATSDDDLTTLARRIVEDFAEIWTQFGRHQQAWAAEGIERTTEVAALGATFTRLAATIEQCLARAAAQADLELIPSAGRMPMLWAVVNGVGDQLVDGRHRLHDCGREEFLSFAAAGLVAAITRPVATGRA
jgi:AcrR family transcriptional regulator